MAVEPWAANIFARSGKEPDRIGMFGAFNQYSNSKKLIYDIRALPARLAPFPETTRRDEQVIAGPVEIIEKAVEDWAVNLGTHHSLSLSPSRSDTHFHTRPSD